MILAPATSAAELMALCEILMVSDPWPLEQGSRRLLVDFADRESARHGFVDWIAYYHSTFPKELSTASSVENDESNGDVNS